MGIYGVADLIKSLLRTSAEFLVTADQYEQLQQITELFNSSPPDSNFSAEQLTTFFVNSIFSTQRTAKRKLLLSIFEFLRLVILNEEESKMGSNNLAIIFGGILFESSSTLDYKVFMTQNKQQGKVLRIILDLFTRNHEYFAEKAAVPTDYFALNSSKIQNQYILKGEPFTQFYQQEEIIYGIFHSKFHTLSPDALLTGFSTDSPIKSRASHSLLVVDAKTTSDFRPTKRKSLRKRLSVRKSLTFRPGNIFAGKSSKTEMVAMFDDLRSSPTRPCSHTRPE